MEGKLVMDMAYKDDQKADTDLNVVMTDASICGLGQAAPNPVRCVQKYFPHEISTSIQGATA